jgi:hypothetical protein|tara:strand:- start:12124 stop:12615 length:492 start_codon:yes stop_codon:yes gene_type:complete
MNSNKKGKSWELEASHLLQEYFGGTFNRVPRSGAMFGGKNIKYAKGQRKDVKEIMSGDIICPEDFPFSVEAKSYGSFNFSKLYDGKSKVLDEWIEQADSDAVLSDREPLILMKFNYKGAYAVFRRYGYKNEGDRIILFDDYTLYKNEYIITSIKNFLNEVRSL